MAEDLQITRPGRKRRSTRIPELRIVLDTNQLFTGSASDLLRSELAQFIQECRRHHDVTFVWYIPEVVRLERRHQMLEAGQKLLPTIHKLERLLGHSLAINDEILSECVNVAIQKQLTDLHVQVLSIDTSLVDWPRLIEDAAGRRPPFEPGEHEKGFRDAIVAETFIQLVSDSPKSSTSCRVVLVTEDRLLATAVATRTSAATNVRILKSLEELKNLVNTVVADVTEEFVKIIRKMAKDYFFIEDDQNSLHYKAKVGEQIATQFNSELKSQPAGSDIRKNGTWFISPPRFIKKIQQRVHWVSTIAVEAKAIRIEKYPKYTPRPFLADNISIQPSVTNILPNITPSIDTDLSEYLSLQLPSKKVLTDQDIANLNLGSSEVLSNDISYGIGDFLHSVYQTREIVVAEGRSVFEVLWSVTVTKNRKFRNPTVDDILYVETTWDGGPTA